MMFKDLARILKDIPILFEPNLKGLDKGVMRTAEGVAVQRIDEDGFVMKYTVINYRCDDMVRTLLHESIHHYYGGTNEWYVEQLEKKYWDEPKYRKLCQEKIVELCGRWNL